MGPGSLPNTGEVAQTRQWSRRLSRTFIQWEDYSELAGGPNYKESIMSCRKRERSSKVHGQVTEGTRDMTGANSQSGQEKAPPSGECTP